MDVWVGQSILEKKYACFGHFYSIVANGQEYRCRSVLEIVNANLKFVVDDLSNRVPDAVAIMMNPGASRPAYPSVEMQVAANDLCSMKTSLVLTCPDQTQYQIMRIMEFKNWLHIRILNLSDLRDAESSRFYDYFPRVERSTNSDSHSIFSKNRTAELNKKLSNNDCQIIAAWGVSARLNPLISRCMSATSNRLVGVKGVKKAGTLDKYYHPLLQGKPMTQAEWLAKICNELR